MRCCVFKNGVYRITIMSAERFEVYFGNQYQGMFVTQDEATRYYESYMRKIPKYYA